jgi:drug/metabolite transporter (DMT)-like permease
MDRGETGNYDMSLTQSLSVLPDNVLDLAHEAGMEEHDKEGRTPLVQYLTLLGAVAGISSNSTALHMLTGVAAPMKLFWRMSASYLILSPLAIHYLIKDGIPKLSVGGWLTFAMAILCFAIQNCLFYTALQYTTIGNAVIYSNSQAVLLIIGKGCVGEPIHLFEGIGVVVAFSGAVLCSTDSESSSDEKDATTTAIYGDCLALLAAAVGVMYLTCAKAVRSAMSVTLFIFCVMFFGSFMVLLFIALTDGEHLEWSMDPHIGVFGGFSTYLGRIFILLYLAVVCNCLGTMGIVRAMEYFDNVVIAVATLMEPLLASLIAFAFHAGLLPGPLGWLGNILVVAGTLAVVYPSMNKKDTTIH